MDEFPVAPPPPAGGTPPPPIQPVIPGVQPSTAPPAPLPPMASPTLPPPPAFHVPPPPFITSNVVQGKPVSFEPPASSAFGAASSSQGWPAPVPAVPAGMMSGEVAAIPVGVGSIPGVGPTPEQAAEGAAPSRKNQIVLIVVLSTVALALGAFAGFILNRLGVSLFG